MRWVTFDDGRDVGCGVIEGDTIHCSDDGVQLIDLVASGREKMMEAGERTLAQPAATKDLHAVRLLPPIPRPPSLRGFMSFEQHLRNSFGGKDPRPEWYEQPVFYFGNTASLFGPYDDVPLAPGTAMWDYEIELAAVVGTAGADLTVEHAEDHIAGYVVLCDFSARDIQLKEMRLSLGPSKGKDTATSFGPWLVTPDELDDVRVGKSFELAARASVNGAVIAESTVADLHWSFGEMLAHASRGTRVLPGDVISSGTVGNGSLGELRATAADPAAQPDFLQPGDELVIEIDRIGQLRHTVVAYDEGR